MRRLVDAHNARDRASLSNLFAKGDDFRGIGTDAEEWIEGGERFQRILDAQLEEMPPFTIDIESLDAFEDGSFGWAVARTAFRTSTGDTPLRITAVLVIEAGMWRVVHWHASVPTPNVELLGVELTTTLDNLLTSVSEDSSAMESLSGFEGTMTLVFTDIADSTTHAEAIGDRTWVELIARHDSAIREVTESGGGSVIKMLGDGSMLAFASVRAAIAASVHIQQLFEAEPYSVRIGVHTGDVIHSGNDLLGLTVNKAVRISSAADGGTTMVSSTVRDLVGTVPGRT